MPIYTILEPLGYPVYLQGSLAEDAPYPESFFTFWNYETTEKFYDGEPWSCTWAYDVAFYTSDPAIRISKLLEAAKELKKSGYVIDGKGEDVPSDVNTHTGRSLTVYFTEIYGG